MLAAEDQAAEGRTMELRKLVSHRSPARQLPFNPVASRDTRVLDAVTPVLSPSIEGHEVIISVCTNWEAYRRPS